MIYFVVPKLVIQKSWGGNFIAEQKGLQLGNLTIGQSYEFTSESMLVPAKNIAKVKVEKYPYIVGTNKKGDGELKNKVKGIQKIKDLDTKELFGTRFQPL